MTNYYATGRTNYFEVVDADEFKKVIEAMLPGLRVVSQEDKETAKKLVALISNDEFGFVWNGYDEEAGDDFEVDWEGIFKEHLVDGSVAIIMEAGSEGQRYVAGCAIAFNNRGESRAVHLDDIYNLAKELGDKITHASY
jgi:hypothetical protein